MVLKRTKKCYFCGKKFSSSGDKYCRHECYWKDMKGKQREKRRNGNIVKCKNCSTDFYRSKKSTQKFCSKKCYLINHSQYTRNVSCEVCNKIFTTSRKIARFCSNKCYLKDHKKIFKPIKCPICKMYFFVSVKLTDKNKCCSPECAQKLRINHPGRSERIGVTLKEKYASGKRVSWNNGKTKFNNDSLMKMSKTKKVAYASGKIVAWNKGVKMSKELREANSKRMTEAYLSGKMDKVGYGKYGYYFSKKNKKKLHYRSSYELIAYKILEQLSKVKSYETEPFRIGYVDIKSVKRNTIPDILVTYTDNSKELIEVKPEFKLDWPNEQVKLKAMKQFADNNNMPFSIWTESELGLN